MKKLSADNAFRSLDGYVELRHQENRNSAITLLNGDLVANAKMATAGISARAFHQGCWGFASYPGSDSVAVDKVIHSARDNARVLGDRVNTSFTDLPDTPFHGEYDFSTKKPIQSPQHRIDFVRDLDAYIAHHHPQLQSRRISLRTEDMEKQVWGSCGSRSYSLIPRTLLYMWLTVENKHGEPVELVEPLASRGQFEDCYEDPADIYPVIDEMVEHLMHKKQAIPAAAGVKDVVMCGKLAGMLAHEAVGHTTEADCVRGGSIAGDLLNQPVASPLVSMVDFAHSMNGELLPVPVHIDDEGVEATDAVLIEHGILKGYMHNRESAGHYDMPLTGNARAFKFSDEPLIRMRNTAVLPGKDNLEDMIASIEDGYYLVKTGNGQADSTSEFMFSVSLGYEIKKGKLGRCIQDTTISGIAFDMLKTVDMVSSRMVWDCAGYCGKKQLIPVGMGGPDIKCRVNIGGQ